LVAPLAGTSGSKYYENGQNEIGTKLGIAFHREEYFTSGFSLFWGSVSESVTGDLARIGYAKLSMVVKSLDIPAKKKLADA